MFSPIPAESQFFIHLGKRVSIAGITDHPDASWMSQVARNATLEELGYLHAVATFAGSRCQVLR
jgi:hypothetical protein